MRRRLRSGMARRIGEDGSFKLSPRAMRIGGWVVAVLLIVGTAVFVGVIGGDGDGIGVGASPSPSGSADADAAPITFGTALDEATGSVAEQSETDRFVDGDLFVYSVASEGAVPAQVFVEVRRTGGGDPAVVQAAVDAQRLPNPQVIAFSVPAAELLAVFGAGDYTMLIYADPEQAPIAEGTFQLADPTPSPPGSPSASP